MRVTGVRAPFQELKQHYEWTSYRFLVEGVSEAFMHISNALERVNVHGNRINIWDLVDSGDARQLLKILDTHPEETIALVASLSAINSTQGVFLSHKDVRRIVCNFYFNSSFWDTPNRTRFIKEVCSFDPHQLLKTVTSEEYYVSKSVP